MPQKDAVQDFIELRAGLVGMQAFASAALALLDQHGIGMARPSRLGRPPGNGHGNGKNGHALVAKTKELILARRGSGTNAAKAEQRARSAALLAQLDTVEPRPIPEAFRRGIAPLLNHGYIKQKGEGYVRTAKEFSAALPSRAAASAPSDAAALTIAQAAKVLKMSDAGVRLLMKNKRLKYETETRVPKGRTKPIPVQVIARDEIARYQATEA